MRQRHDQYAFSFFFDANQLFLRVKNARKQRNVFEKTKQPASALPSTFGGCRVCIRKNLKTSNQH
jgi:hypothetical protein